MSLERPSNKIERSAEARYLRDLEATGRYVFHGSPTPDIQVLEPRQGYNFPKGKKETHGAPAISATPYADIAIFRALVTEDSTSFGQNDDGSLHFGASEKALQKAQKAVGYVYVLAKDSFLPMNGEAREMEWRSNGVTWPLKIIKVKAGDIPVGVARIESAKKK